MRISRRIALSAIAGTPALLLSRRSLAQETQLEIAPGPFKGTRESLREWQVPDWYRDAKFGIWAHWGPQSGVEYGDWYARNMYIQGSKQYEYHVKVYGHP
ncbi:MAG: alpha-L-fucosidase, partial [Acidobacteriaceae bacterium]|nr:alpha-L-fucosidase [Acidobacteriaceae bacterium]